MMKRDSRVMPSLGDVGYCYWFGASGHKYVHSVYSIASWPGHLYANIMLVRNDPDEGRQILWVGQSGPVYGQVSEDGAMAKARAQGANEVHVHLLGKHPAVRRQIVADLRRVTMVGMSGLGRIIKTAANEG